MENTQYARVLNVLAKIKNGQEVTVAAFGGSITTGYNSNPLDQNSWRALTGLWFLQKAEECGAKVKYINEGCSGTDSAFGAARAQFHLKKNNVDLVLLEFAMNDQWLEPKVRLRSYEGVIRQVQNGTDAAILALFVNERFGNQSGQQYEQQPVCEYYDIPYVSWKDEENRLHNNKVNWDAFFDGEEGIHPSNAGHKEISELLIKKLDFLWNEMLENSSTLPQVTKDLPAPLYKDNYEFIDFYRSDNLKPIENTGWTPTSPLHPEWVNRGNAVQGWSTSTENAELVFKVTGKSVNLLFCESDGFRDCEAWIEFAEGCNSKKVTLKCFNSIRKGYLGWSSKELVNLEIETEFIIHIVCPKRRATEQGRPTNVCGIIVGH